MAASSALAGLAQSAQQGWHDDHQSGVLLAGMREAHLVKVPLGQNSTVVSGLSGSGTATFSANSGSTNADGTGRQVTLTAPALTAGNGGQQGAYVEQTIYGPRIGVRFRRDNGAANYPFTVTVDGVSYAVRNVNARRHSVQQSFNDYDALFLVPDEFGPGAHSVNVSIAADQVGGASRSIVIYGFIADRVAGYEDRRRLGLFPASAMQAMPTAETVITGTSMGGIRKLHWYNTDSSTHTITIRAGTGAGNDLKVISIAAGAYAEYDFGEPVMATTSSQAFLRWLCDSALVTYLIQEGA